MHDHTRTGLVILPTRNGPAGWCARCLALGTAIRSNRRPQGRRDRQRVRCQGARCQNAAQEPGVVGADGQYRARPE